MSLVVAILLALFVLPSPWGLVAVGVSAVWEVGETWLMIRWTQRRRAQVGVETLVGRSARVVVACAPTGQVAVKGERWQARCDAGADVGATVEIVGVEGLMLVVEPPPAG